ncbi:MAG: extracellular solute-binding protein [Granulosicoccus sp.]|nr:extracellular solute-binding protein [Granulosicoccus sp.]
MNEPKNFRRRLLGKLLAGYAIAPATIANSIAQSSNKWHVEIANAARQSRETGPVQLLIPDGSQANIVAATELFTQLSGVRCQISEVPVDEINVEMMLQASSEHSSFDVALPATFGLPDLVEAGTIYPLDEFAERFEPAEFSSGQLYRQGDFYQGHLYGYQTDGDAYVLFYNKQMLEDPNERAAYEQTTGMPLQVASNWQELDQMMKFFHRPEQNIFGGCLFRNPGYLAWEWWARLHAKGILPLADDMRPLVDTDQGIEALRELIAATEYQTPESLTNGLFENWEDFSQGKAFCNIGWGGTQKYLMSQAAMRDNLIHTPLPGFDSKSDQTTMGYFNWGWNYTVSSKSARKELAYLLALFCVSPVASTLAVREQAGYFDPFHESHYSDAEIQNTYGKSFLSAHRDSMGQCIPDFYLRGQGKYMDALREQIVLALQGEISPEAAMKTCAKRWNHITRRLGIEIQREQWLALKSSYPRSFASAL